MANYFPVIVESGSIKQMTNRYVIDPIHFYMTRSVSPTSGSYATRLPDPYYVQTSSADVTVTSNTVSSSVIPFSLKVRPETQYYIHESILAGRSATAATTGPRVSVERQNLTDGFFKIMAATSLTAVAIRNQGTADAQATASMTTTVANNVPVPIGIKGVFQQSTTTGTFLNTIKTVTAGGISTTIKSGSVSMNHFAGISSSVTPTTASSTPLTILSGTLDDIRGGNLVTASVLPLTATSWFTKSLVTPTAGITSSVLNTWEQVFFTGGTTGATYLVHFFLRCSSPATTTGVWVRTAGCLNYNGFIYTHPSSNNSVHVSSSSGSNAIENRQATGIPSIDSPRIFYGEYTFEKNANNNTIDIMTEVNGSTITCTTGSFVMYRRIDTQAGYNDNIVSPLMLFSGSLSSHTNTLNAGRALAMISSSLPAIDTAFWNYKIKTETTYVTSSTQTPINELTVNLSSNGGTTGWHLIIGYYAIGCSSTTTGVRLGNSQASTTQASVVTEVPDTATSVQHNYEGSTGPPTTTSPSNNINNFYFAKHIFLGKPNSTTGTFTPSIAVSTAGAGITASMGPSIVFWKRIT
jgi:hypothetical protein